MSKPKKTLPESGIKYNSAHEQKKGQDTVIVIGDKTIAGSDRGAFFELVRVLAHCVVNQADEISISQRLVLDLVKRQKTLKLQVALHLDCQNCGGGIG